MDFPVYVPDVVGSLLLFLAVGFVAGYLYGRSVVTFALWASLLYAYSNVPVFARLPIDETHLASYYMATALLGVAIGHTSGAGMRPSRDSWPPLSRSTHRQRPW